MKNFKSNIEGQWLEMVPLELSNEQKGILMKRQFESEEFKQVQEYISNNSTKPASEEDALILNNAYNKYKPTLKDTDTYELISVNITLTDTGGRGIINCRVNGEHKQIRAYE